MARILLAFLAVAAFRVASCATPPDAGAGWTTVVSKGAFGEYDAGAAAFASAMAQAPHKLIRRDCSSCSADTAKTVFYKRVIQLSPCGSSGLADHEPCVGTGTARCSWASLAAPSGRRSGTRA